MDLRRNASPLNYKTFVNLVTTVLTIVSFIFFLWLNNTYFSFDIKSPSRHLKNNSDSIPSMVWYTNIISSVSQVRWVLRNRRIHCTEDSRNFECDVLRPESQPENPGAYLFYISYLDRFPLPRNPKTIWGLVHDESPVARLVLLFEEALNVFNFSATFSRNSDVPFPLNWMRGLEEITSPQFYVPTWKKTGLLGLMAPVVYMQSDCSSLTERDSYVQRLMKYIKIDSYGECLHNKDLPLNQIYTNVEGTRTYRFHMYGQELLTYLAQYKFIIAIEVGVCNDYVTEKFWRAIELGVIPIYYGSPLIRDWLPNNKSAILLEDFPTPELLSQHLHYLLNNDTAYEEYLEHKTLGLVSNQRILDELTERPYQNDLGSIIKKFECKICGRLHDIDSAQVNIVTRSHYDCPIPNDLSYIWQIDINDSISKIDRMFEEMASTNKTPRVSKTSWW